MRLYIAAPWNNKDEARAAALLFEKAGHTITQKWWNEPPGADLDCSARADWKGVTTANVVIVLNIAKSEGKAVEQGIALQAGIPIVGVRGRKQLNVFQHLTPEFTWLQTVEEAIEYLKGRYTDD